MMTAANSIAAPTAAEDPCRDLLRDRLGLVIPLERLVAAVRRLGYRSTLAATIALRHEPLDSAAWQKLLRELAIGETYFFRGSQPLEAAIEALVAARSGRLPSPITAWSAGCATGEEAYTLAILLRAALPGEWPIRVIGTDINVQALGTARRGLYGSWSFRSDDALRRGGFIAEGAKRWRVNDDVRPLVDFRLLNLADPTAHYPAADLIVCRNVLLYLAPPTREAIQDRLPRALQPGGILILDDQLSRHQPLSTVNDGSAVTPEVAADPNLYERARSLTDAGQLDAALDVLQAADPLDLACAWLVAQIQMQRGDFPPLTVMRAIQRCLYIDPNFALGYVALGNWYAAQGDQRSARRQWVNAAQIAASIAPDAPIPFGEGLTAGDLHQVIADYRRES